MREIIVVEGRDDSRRLKEVFPDIETIETRGSAIDQKTLDLIKKAHEERGVIVLTDPDFPGEKIRKTITAYVPSVKHAFLKVDEALPKKAGSLGVEHASPEALKRALQEVQTVQDNPEKPTVEARFLRNLGLVGGEKSAYHRKQLAEKLGIGQVNGKQLEKRLNMFGISADQVQEALVRIKEDENGLKTH